MRTSKWGQEGGKECKKIIKISKNKKRIVFQSYFRKAIVWFEPGQVFMVLEGSGTLLQEKSKPPSHPAMKLASYNNDKVISTCARVTKCYGGNQPLADGT